MAFHVNWLRPARDMLAEMWVSAPDRTELSRSANAIDALLKAGRCDSASLAREICGWDSSRRSS